MLSKNVGQTRYKSNRGLKFLILVSLALYTGFIRPILKDFRYLLEFMIIITGDFLNLKNFKQFSIPMCFVSSTKEVFLIFQNSNSNEL